MSIEAKKQECRDILEKGINSLCRKTDNPSWFDWDRFNEDLTEAMEELEREAKK